MNKTAVICVVGLNQSLITDATPNLKKYFKDNQSATLTPPLPAVTCSVQSSILTGVNPGQHGIVGNGWYDRDLCEVQFWKQSNKLVRSQKIWETAKKRDNAFTCLNMFWWYNMYSSVDYSVTPRPIYKADGRKIPDCYSFPDTLRDELQNQFGPFPLFHFWGPAASIESSEWISQTSQYAMKKYSPTLSLIYLPHLDYALQKLGPNDPNIPNYTQEIDAVIGQLLEFCNSQNIAPIILSEYGIESVEKPIHINRYLRDDNSIHVRKEMGLELLDPQASDAFAVADHQVAHIYIQNKSKISYYETLCKNISGIAQVLNAKDQESLGIDHERSGELLLVAEKNHWFTYYYWLEDQYAPDFSRTVDIHRKPGYDPCELFVNPDMTLPKVQIAMKILKRKLGLRSLLDIIPLDASLVKGSHGRVSQVTKDKPILITPNPNIPIAENLPCHKVYDVILDHLFYNH